MATSTARVWSDEELLALPQDGKYELVDGELVYMSPAGAKHGKVIVRLTARIYAFVAQRNLGDIFDGQTGFRFPSGNLRSPDVSFVRAGRLEGGVPAGFFHLAPDLAVEVLSPSDRAGDVAHKVAECLSAGVGLLWVVDPEKETAVVYRPGLTPRTVRKDGALEGEDILPGFSLRVSDLG